MPVPILLVTGKEWSMQDKLTRRRKRKKERTPIGWREWVEFPDFEGVYLKAKIDTGARTSALHAFNVRESNRDGELWISFRLHPRQKRKTPSILCRAKVHDIREIRSSNGKVENRYVIRTRIRIGDRTRTVEITLTNRDEMGYRMLVGRTAMRDKFIIQPDKSWLQGDRKDWTP